MQFLWKYIDDLVGKGLEINEIMTLLFYASARFVPLALPIAMLLSSLMVFGKLGENNELTALKASGISFIKLIYPLFIFALIISFSSFLFSNYLMPIANLKNGSMIYDIQKKKPALNIKEGIFYKDIEGYTIKIGKKKSDGKELEDIIIYNHSNKNGNTSVITAKKGKMEITKNEKYLELTLNNGFSYNEIINPKTKIESHRKTKFKENLIRFDLSTFNKRQNSEHLYKGHYAMLNNKQLTLAIDSLNQKVIEKKNAFHSVIKEKYQVFEKNEHQNLKTNTTKINKNKQYDIALNSIKTLKSIVKSNRNEIEYKNIILAKHKIEWHRKISLAVACMILFFIGASLGSIVSKGGFGFPALISICFFLSYHVLSIIGEKSAKDLTLEPFEGMWLANITFFPISIFLMYKAKNDAKIFDTSNLKLSIFAFLKKENEI